LPKKSPEDGAIALSGKWRTDNDGEVSAERQTSAQLQYHARSVYAVLSIDNPKKPVPVNLLQDGKPVSKEEAGVDIRFEGETPYVEVSEPRMYDLLKNREFGRHLLGLEPQAAGVSLHTFTFGNDCQQDFDHM
jgi:hypothetical protein